MNAPAHSRHDDAMPFSVPQLTGSTGKPHEHKRESARRVRQPKGE